MDNKLYIELSERTESMDFVAIAERLQDPFAIRLLHMGMGMSTEANEILDALKKFIFYGKQLDVVNLAEEMGDQFWYLAGMARVLGYIDFDTIMATNIEKLQARFPDKFEEHQALNRNLDKERHILEKCPNTKENFKCGSLCLICHGTGKRIEGSKEDKEPNIKSIKVEEKCPECKGKGRTYVFARQNTCRKCYGTGKISEKS